MKRRAFLQSTFFTYLALNLSVKDDLWAASQVDRSEVIYATKIEGQYYLNLYNFKNSEHLRLPIPFRVHSVQNLGDKRVLLIEKKGTGCCIVDFKTKSIVKLVQESAENVFYGHGEIDFKIKKIYFPQREDGKNQIFIRSLDTLEKVSESIYQTKKEIHMISMLEEDRLAICIDDKVAPSIDILNLKDRSVRSILIENHYFRPGHICPVSEGNMYVSGIVGNDYDGAAILNYHFKDLAYINKEQVKKLKPVFWISHHVRAKVLCGVSPDSNEVLFIAPDSKKILKQETVIAPYGVDVAGDEFVIIGPKGLTFFNAKKLVKNKSMAYPEMAHMLEDFHPIIV